MVLALYVLFQQGKLGLINVMFLLCSLEVS